MEDESILKICCLYDKLDNNSNIDVCIYFGKKFLKGGGGSQQKFVGFFLSWFVVCLLKIGQLICGHLLKP